MGIYTPRIVVASPAFVPAKYGLMSVVGMPSGDDDERAASSGAIIEVEACGPAEIFVDECPADPENVKEVEQTNGIRSSDDFTLFAYDMCSPVGRTPAEAKRRTGAFLTNGEGRTVESVFWTGGPGAAVEPHLAENAEVIDADGHLLQPAATVVGEVGGQDPVNALRILETELGLCYGGQGVIHMPSGDATWLGAAGALVVDGERLRTFRGNLVAAGSGYPGTSPAGVAPAAGTSWWYATGAIDLRRSDILWNGQTDAEFLDRARNTRVVIAERTYTIVWDCCLLAVLVDFTGGP